MASRMPSGRRRWRVALLPMVPWLALTLGLGGRHNHAPLAGLARCGAKPCQFVSTCSGSCDRTSTCSACLWHAASVGAASAAPVIATPAAGEKPLTCAGEALPPEHAAPARSRAPPSS